MNPTQALVRVELKNRGKVALIALEFMILLKIVPHAFGTSSSSGALGLLSWFVLGTMWAGLLGCEFGTKTTGGWAWLWSRPIERRSLFWVRVRIDLFLLFAIALCYTLAWGLPEPMTPAISLFLLVYFWLSFHGLSAGFGSLGFGLIGSFLLTVFWWFSAFFSFQFLGEFFLNAGGRLASQTSVIEWYSSLGRHYTNAGIFEAQTRLAPTFSAWCLIGGVVMAGLPAIWGWKISLQQINHSPQRLDLKRTTLRAMLWFALAFFLLNAVVGLLIYPWAFLNLLTTAS